MWVAEPVWMAWSPSPCGVHGDFTTPARYHVLVVSDINGEKAVVAVGMATAGRAGPRVR